MLKKIAIILILTVSTSCFARSMQKDIDTATEVFMEVKSAIPREVLENARGLAILHMFKAGLIVSGRGGSGVIIARTGTGWSAPAAIGGGGAGLGLQIGAEETDLVLVLNSKEAVDIFIKNGRFSLGADVSVAAGPGKSATSGVLPRADIYSYSKNEGLFAGVSVEGTDIDVHNEENAEYYKKPVTAEEILSGKVPQPKGAQRLYEALDHSGVKSSFSVGSILIIVLVVAIGIGLGVYFTRVKKR